MGVCLKPGWCSSLGACSPLFHSICIDFTRLLFFFSIIFLLSSLTFIACISFNFFCLFLLYYLYIFFYNVCLYSILYLLFMKVFVYWFPGICCITYMCLCFSLLPSLIFASFKTIVYPRLETKLKHQWKQSSIIGWRRNSKLMFYTPKPSMKTIVYHRVEAKQSVNVLYSKAINENNRLSSVGGEIASSVSPYSIHMRLWVWWWYLHN